MRVLHIDYLLLHFTSHTLKVYSTALLPLYICIAWYPLLDN